MQRILSFFILILIIGLTQSFYGQKLDKDYFISPLSIPLNLSGTFAELRTNHFHTGIDIKTGGAIGKTVHATADGYVSRIKVSPYGYGKALYIRHPNGFTTVYAHLDSYNSRIDSFLKAEQYRIESFAVDYFPEKNLILVKKGEVVGLSGNSGGSGGPHLHYEIRDAAERPVNPLYSNIKVVDNIKPTIKGIRFYFIINGQKGRFLEFNNKSGLACLTLKDTVSLTNNFYVGVNSIDRQSGSNQNGFYDLQIYLDSQLVHQVMADRLDFDEQRYINSYIDYSAFYNQSVRYRTTIVLPGNKLSIYETNSNNGIFTLTDTAVHKMEIIVRDFAGNETKEIFFVKGSVSPLMPSITHKPNFFHDKPNFHSIPEASFTIPSGCLYEDIYFEMKVLQNKYNNYSPLISVGSPEIPLHCYATLSIKTQNIPDKFRNKAAIASFTKSGSLYYEGGTYSDGQISVKTRSFGIYLIVIDSINPIIKPIDVFNGKNITKQKTISFKITDNLSGIKSYRGELNGKWIVGDYDAKNDLILFALPENLESGEHTFSLKISDEKSNYSKITYKLKKD